VDESLSLGRRQHQQTKRLRATTRAERQNPGAKEMSDRHIKILLIEDNPGDVRDIKPLK